MMDRSFPTVSNTAAREANSIAPSVWAHRVGWGMVENPIVLSYEGKVNQRITLALAASLQRSLEEDEGIALSIKKRIYHVAVECLQNISKHAGNVELDESGPAIFLASRSPSGFHVVTGNLILNTSIMSVAQMLEKVNGMDEKQIKAYYREKIVENRIRENGGAGLGFIDIVRKTGHNIDFRLEPVNEATSFLIVKALIS